MKGKDERGLLELAYAAGALKDQPRAGWVNHEVSLPESVADHSWGTAYLCLLFAPAAGTDPLTAVTTAILHDLPEALTGDFATRLHPADRTHTEEEKCSAEERAADQLFPTSQPQLRRLWDAYGERSTAAALFVREMNLIDMCLQALRYERERRYDTTKVLSSQGEHEHLDEFFEGARTRLTSELGHSLFALIHQWYLEARGA